MGYDDNKPDVRGGVDYTGDDGYEWHFNCFEDIKQLEVENNLKLPKHYKAFLLKWNGGTPEPSIFKISDEQGSSVMNYYYSMDDTYNDIEDYFDKGYTMGLLQLEMIWP